MEDHPLLWHLYTLEQTHMEGLHQCHTLQTLTDLQITTLDPLLKDQNHQPSVNKNLKRFSREIRLYRVVLYPELYKMQVQENLQVQ